jgi:hypothetical protein
MIIKESQGDFLKDMPLLIDHYYDYNGKAAYGRTEPGRYRLKDYQSNKKYCQIIVTEGYSIREWVVDMRHLTYFGPCKESISTNQAAIHLLKGEPI